MARVVLVYFDDNEDAELFIDNLKFNNGWWDGSGFAPTRVMGMWAYPTSFCECDPPPLDKDMTRGATLGWHVDRRCGKPRPGYQLAKNLLLPHVHPGDYSCGVHFSTAWPPRKPRLWSADEEAAMAELREHNPLHIQVES